MSIPGPRVPRRRTNSRPPHPDRPLNSQVISSVARRLDACKKIVRTYKKIYGATLTLGEADQGEHHQLSVVSNALGRYRQTCAGAPLNSNSDRPKSASEVV
jgi:hypothetical protein